MTANDHLSLFLEQGLCYIRGKTTNSYPKHRHRYQFIPPYLIHIPKWYKSVICPWIMSSFHESHANRSCVPPIYQLTTDPEGMITIG